MSDTRTRILDTAERLFGENGYDATSLRQIIAAAAVNLAAIHYHFGSKEELLDELIVRKAEPVNQERIARLDAVLAAAGARPPAVEEVLKAFMEPMSTAAEQNPQFVKVMGRLHAEGLLPGVVQRHFQQVVMRFRAAMRRALPDLPDEELLWRLHFMIGAMAHTMCSAPEAAGLELGQSDFRDRIARLVAFLSGGFRAPLAREPPPADSGKGPGHYDRSSSPAGVDARNASGRVSRSQGETRQRGSAPRPGAVEIEVK